MRVKRIGKIEFKTDLMDVIKTEKNKCLKIFPTHTIAVAYENNYISFKQVRTRLYLLPTKYTYTNYDL